MGHDSRAMPSPATEQVMGSYQGRKLMRASKAELIEYCQDKGIECAGLTKAEMVLAMREKMKEEKEKEPEPEAETGYIYWE